MEELLRFVATIIASATKDDGEARWVKHKGRPAAHGFKAHVGADAETALVEEVALTPAHVNDCRAGPHLGWARPRRRAPRRRRHGDGPDGTTRLHASLFQGAT